MSAAVRCNLSRARRVPEIMLLPQTKAIVPLLLAMSWPLACSSVAVDRAHSRTADSTLLPLAVSVDSAFSYVGSQRFLLRDRADVEQHLFVDASRSGEVRRFVWVQFERFLPTTEGRYQYDLERSVAIDSYQFITSVRQYTVPPEPGSDRSRAYAFVESRGFEMPPVATRARLVHVPIEDPRSELMIVYAERADVTRESSSEEIDALIRRAMATVSVAKP